MNKQLILNVKEILIRQPAYRDSDIRLSYFLWKHFEDTDTMTITAHQLLLLLDKGTISSMESIGRARRKIQEDYPETRGSNYEKRHLHQKKVRETLGYAG